jgi:hypothetical protein
MKTCFRGGFCCKKWLVDFWAMEHNESDAQINEQVDAEK